MLHLIMIAQRCFNPLNNISLLRDSLFPSTVQDFESLAISTVATTSASLASPFVFAILLLHKSFHVDFRQSLHHPLQN
jgi:hypothetical protein